MHKPRAALSFVLIAIGCLLVPVSAVTWWVQQTLVSTDGYVKAVSPLIEAPAIVAAVENSLNHEISTALRESTDSGLDALADTRVPDRVLGALKSHRDDIVIGAQERLEPELHTFLISDRVANIWRSSNRALHHRLMAVLNGDDKVLALDNVTLVLQGQEVQELLDGALIDAGLPRANMPKLDAAIPVAEVPDLAKARDTLHMLNQLGHTLPIVTMGLLLAGVAMANERRRTVLLAAVGTLASGILLLILVHVVKDPVLQAATGSAAPGPASQATFNVIVGPLRDFTTTIVLGASVTIAAALVARRSWRA